jgi:hypothetical protein
MGVTHNLIFHYQIPVNLFLAPENIHGACTAYAYIHSTRTSTYDRPVMYSDAAGKPLEKLTRDEGVIDFKGTAGQPPGWRSAAFSCDTPVEAGACCWFGLFTEYWQTAYDYGGTLSAKVLGISYYDLETIPEQYPQDNLASSLYGDMLSMLSELRLSMYFSYTSAQNYTRTLTQGVTLTDSRKQVAGYKRAMTMNAITGDYMGKVQAWFRIIQEQAATFGEAGHLGDYLRGLYTEAGNMAETRHKGKYYRKVQDTAENMGVSLRHLFIFLRLVTLSFVRDYLIPRFLRSRDEIVLKSPVTRELELDSIIH